MPRLTDLALLALACLCVFGAVDSEGAANLLWQLRNNLATLIGG